MNVDEALAEADDAARYGDSVGPSIAEALAAEVRRLRQESGELLVKGVKLDQALGRAEDEVRRLRTWAGLMSVLDEHYPADVPLGPDSDPGPRILRLTRELDRLRRWLRAVSLGRATKDIHAEIRAYLEETP